MLHSGGIVTHAGLTVSLCNLFTLKPLYRTMSVIHLACLIIVVNITFVVSILTRCFVVVQQVTVCFKVVGLGLFNSLFSLLQKTVLCCCQVQKALLNSSVICVRQEVLV